MSSQIKLANGSPYLSSLSVWALSQAALSRSWVLLKTSPVLKNSHRLGLEAFAALGEVVTNIQGLKAFMMQIAMRKRHSCRILGETVTLT
jgi:hypothetical protein